MKRFRAKQKLSFRQPARSGERSAKIGWIEPGTVIDVLECEDSNRRRCVFPAKPGVGEWYIDSDVFLAGTEEVPVPLTELEADGGLDESKIHCEKTPHV